MVAFVGCPHTGSAHSQRLVPRMPACKWLRRWRSSRTAGARQSGRRCIASHRGGLRCRCHCRAPQPVQCQHRRAAGSPRHQRSRCAGHSADLHTAADVRRCVGCRLAALSRQGSSVARSRGCSRHEGTLPASRLNLHAHHRGQHATQHHARCQRNVPHRSSCTAYPQPPPIRQGLCMQRMKHQQSSAPVQPGLHVQRGPAELSLHVPCRQGPRPSLAAHDAQSVWQGRSSGPPQARQPSGLLQVTERVCVPLPQLLEHGLHAVYCTDLLPLL